MLILFISLISFIFSAKASFTYKNVLNVALQPELQYFCNSTLAVGKKLI